MRLLKLTSLALFASLSMGVSSSLAVDNNAKTSTAVPQASFETAHSTARNRQHKHCHRRLRNTESLREARFVTICHKHRHWPLHHTRKRG